MIVVKIVNFWHYTIIVFGAVTRIFYRYVMLMLIVPVSWTSVSVFCSGLLDGTLTTLDGGNDVTQLPGCMF